MVMTLAFLFAGLIGLALLGAAVWTYYSQEKKAMDGVTTTGEVIDLTREITDPGSPGAYYPAIAFTLPSGEAVTFTSDFGTRPASHKVGQSVTVRYDPDDPQKAEMVSALSKWLVPGILAFIGMIVCCLSVFLLLFFWFTYSP